MTKYTEKIYILLTTLGKIFDSKTFDIHRDTIAEILSIANGIITSGMKSLKVKHNVIDFILSNEREYTVTMIEPSKDICDDVMRYSKEDIKEMDVVNLDHYRKMLEEQKAIQDKYDKLQAERKKERLEKQHESLKKFLEEKRKEQIDNGNKAEKALKFVFDEFGIIYEFKHIELIVDCGGKEHGHLYDFLVEIGKNKYGIDIDKPLEDKKMDELVVGFGIEPIRYKSQMVYAISNGVYKGLIGKKQLIKIIESGLPVTNDMIDVSSFFYNKCIEFECKNRPILEPMEESLMNDEDNKYVNSIKGALNEKIGGEHGEVVYSGKVIPTVTTKTPFTTVTCGTNGYKGGDWGHGSRTYVKVEGGILSEYEIRKIDEDKYGSSSGFEIAVGGDCELDSMIETFEAIVSNLKKMKKEISILDKKDIK